jgi:hypothetical protein
MYDARIPLAEHGGRAGARRASFLAVKTSRLPSDGDFNYCSSRCFFTRRDGRRAAFHRPWTSAGSSSQASPSAALVTTERRGGAWRGDRRDHDTVHAATRAVGRLVVYGAALLAGIPALLARLHSRPWCPRDGRSDRSASETTARSTTSGCPGSRSVARPELTDRSFAYFHSVVASVLGGTVNLQALPIFAPAS